MLIREPIPRDLPGDRPLSRRSLVAAALAAAITLGILNPHNLVRWAEDLQSVMVPVAALDGLAAWAERIADLGLDRPYAMMRQFKSWCEEWTPWPPAPPSEPGT